VDRAGTVGGDPRADDVELWLSLPENLLDDDVALEVWS
jgi:hypothetical protein